MMLAAVALGVALAPSILEVPDPTSDRVTIQAILKLPATGPLGRASADVLSRVLTEDNDTYSKPQMRSLCAPGGEPRCYVMPDSMAISLSVLPADTRIGLRMLAGMLASPRFSLNVMNSYLLSEPKRHRPPWTLALDGTLRTWDRLRAEDIVNMYRTVVRPENLVLAVGGALKPGEAEVQWKQVSGAWRRQPARPLREADPVGDDPDRYDTHVMELRGPEWSPSDPDLAKNLLAMVALGAGKASSMFQVVRQELALSYRQEAVVWPTDDGLVGRILVQTTPKEPETERQQLSHIRAVLLDAVSQWSDTDLARAKGYGRAMLQQGVPNGILYFRPGSPLGSSIEHRTYLAAYWTFKTGGAWDSASLSTAISGVDLKTLKAVATQWLKASVPLLHPSRPD